MAFRYDFSNLRSPVRRRDGSLRVDSYITRAGVFLYRNPDGSIRREYRPPNEVFKADALESFAMIPVTDDHPPEMVTAENARSYAVGAVGESVRRDGNKVAAQLAIFDKSLIEKMDAGKVQVSCGYEVDLIEEPGISPEGERYDVVQRNIRGNHVAIVQVGRAGGSVRVRMDAAMMVQDSADHFNQEKIFMTLEEAIKRIGELESLHKAAEERADTEKARADHAEGERDSAKKAVEKAEKARQDAEDSFDSKVAARVDLVAKAQKVLGDVDGGQTDRQLKIAVVKKVDGDDIADDKSDDYVGGRFDAAMKSFGQGEQAVAKANEAAHTDAGDSQDREAAAAKRNAERSRNAYKNAAN